MLQEEALQKFTNKKKKGEIFSSADPTNHYKIILLFSSANQTDIANSNSLIETTQNKKFYFISFISFIFMATK